MKFNILRTSQTLTGFYHKEDPKPYNNAKLVINTEGCHYEIEINSLEDLIKLQEEVNESLIISDDYDMKGMCSKSIEIYDAYRE